MLISIDQIKLWLLNLNKRLQEKKEYLTDLDQAIGDGDHGLNMARGFKEVSTKIQNTEYETIGALLKDTGMTLLAKVGGASGPLYGTAFLKAAAVIGDKPSITVEDLSTAFEAGLDGIMVRGKANLSDKTMIDVWQPVVNYLKNNHENMDWDEVIRIASENMEATKEMEAKKGRAAYLGKRSIGHIDPGSASSNYFFSELAHVLKGDINE